MAGATALLGLLCWIVFTHYRHPSPAATPQSNSERAETPTPKASTSNVSITIANSALSNSLRSEPPTEAVQTPKNPSQPPALRVESSPQSNQPALGLRSTNAMSGLSEAATPQAIENSNRTSRTSFPLPLPQGFPRSPSNPFEVQVALARLGFSPGSIDGVFGSQTRSALAAWQAREGLPATGVVDPSTRSRLVLAGPVEESYVLSSNDFAGLQPLSATWLGKSKQSALAYESVLESLAERRLSSPNLLVRMNPGVDWTNLIVGTSVKLPVAAPLPSPTPASLIRIRLSARHLAVFDASGRAIAHYPCSIARKVEKRPVGRLHVANIAAPPNYTFDPANFPESSEAQTLGRKLTLPPGPNNPVGTAWIGLDLPGYGIHGTPRPEEVGRTESHGCFRLANWNAEHLVRLVRTGIPVEVEP